MYSFFARVGHPDIRWSIVSSYSLHNLLLLLLLLLSLLLLLLVVVVVVVVVVVLVKLSNNQPFYFCIEIFLLLWFLSLLARLIL
jgi:hypothetical protein